MLISLAQRMPADSEKGFFVFAFQNSFKKLENDVLFSLVPLYFLISFSNNYAMNEFAH
jgi:hypothetical protein